MRFIASMFALLAFTTGVVAAPGFMPTERIYAEVQTNLARTVLRQRLPGFQTAQFQGVFATVASLKDPMFGDYYDAYAICGQIKIKNAYSGEYSGWTVFAVVRDAGPVGAPSAYFGSNSDDLPALMRHCDANGGLVPRMDQSPRYTSIIEGHLRPGQAD